MRASPDVREFMAPIDPSIGDVVDLMVDGLAKPETAKNIAAAMQSVKRQLRNPKTPVMTGAQYLTLTHIRRHRRPALGVPLEISHVETLAATLFMRAESDMRRAGIGPLARDLSGSMKKVPTGLKAMRDDFLGDLTVDAERRLNQSGAFAKEFRRSIKKMQDMQTEVEASAAPLKALMLDNNDPFDCECVVHACNSVECRDFCIGSFWVCLLIFLGIILILVLA